MLKHAGLSEQVFDRIAERVRERVLERTQQKIKVSVILVSMNGEVLGVDTNARSLENWRK